MARPAPADLDYAPTFAQTLTAATTLPSAANPTTGYDITQVDNLAKVFTECPFAATEAIVNNSHATLHRNLVVRMQGVPGILPATPSTVGDVIIPIAPLTTVWIRAAFAMLRATTDAEITATFFWQGGPS